MGPAVDRRSIDDGQYRALLIRRHRRDAGVGRGAGVDWGWIYLGSCLLSLLYFQYASQTAVKMACDLECDSLFFNLI